MRPADRRREAGTSITGTQDLATGDVLGNVNIRDSADGQRLASLPEGGSGFSSLAFSPSGHILAIGGGNGNITLLRLDFTDLTPQFFTNLICGKVHGNVTQTEWADYVPGQPYQQTCP